MYVGVPSRRGGGLAVVAADVTKTVMAQYCCSIYLVSVWKSGPAAAPRGWRRSSPAGREWTGGAS